MKQRQYCGLLAGPRSVIGWHCSTPRRDGTFTASRRLVWKLDSRRTVQPRRSTLGHVTHPRLANPTPKEHGLKANAWPPRSLSAFWSVRRVSDGHSLPLLLTSGDRRVSSHAHLHHDGTATNVNFNTSRRRAAIRDTATVSRLSQMATPIHKSYTTRHTQHWH